MPAYLMEQLASHQHEELARQAERAQIQSAQRDTTRRRSSWLRLRLRMKGAEERSAGRKRPLGFRFRLGDRLKIGVRNYTPIVPTVRPGTSLRPTCNQTIDVDDPLRPERPDRMRASSSGGTTGSGARVWGQRTARAPLRDRRPDPPGCQAAERQYPPARLPTVREHL
jgi:hypothetical protein